MKTIVMMMLTAIISFCIVPLYAGDQGTKRGYAGHYVIRYEEATIKGKTGFYYILYGTQGINKGMQIAYTDEFATLTTKYDLSQKQLEQIAYQQAARIKDLESVNERLADDSKNLAPLRETASKISTTKD